MFVRLEDLPADFPVYGGLPAPTIRWDAHREMSGHIVDREGTPGTFHLKNRGITLVAQDVRQPDDDGYEIDFLAGQGIIDGRTVYQLIVDAQRNPDIDLPFDQHVKLEIITGVSDSWLPEMSKGLNTHVQVQSQHLLSLQPSLQWIRDCLSAEPYYRDIAWTETERGIYDIVEIIGLMACFNIEFSPNQGSNHPVAAYADPSLLMRTFVRDAKQDDGRSYKRLRPILRDVLRLHDIVAEQFPAQCKPEQLQALDGVVEHATAVPFRFPFTDTSGHRRLAKGARLPIVAAFRWLVAEDPDTGNFRWRRGFDEVLSRWQHMSGRFIRETAEKHRELGRGADAIGRSSSHWSTLHKEIAFMDLLDRPSSAAAVSQTDSTGAAVAPASKPPADR